MIDTRGSSMLPSIKCSNCGAEIEISMMGEHVCQGVEKEAQRPVYGSKSNLEPSYQRPAYHDPNTNLRPTRAIPPRIDPSAANRPYVHTDLLTPNSHTSSPLRSPVSPLTDEQKRMPTPSRSMTSPMPRFRRPPSPELSSNLDCAFPPFPASTPTRSESPASRPASRKDSSASGGERRVFSEPESFLDRRSPEVNNAIRMNKAQSPVMAGYSRDKPSMERAMTVDQGNTGWPLKREWQSHAPSILEHVSDTAYQVQEGRAALSVPDRSTSAPPVQVSTAAGETRVSGRSVPMRPQRPQGVDGFLMHLKEDTAKENEPALAPLRPTDRSNTFPVSVEQQPLNRRPSEPAYLPKRPTVSHSAFSAPGNLPRSMQVSPADRAAARNGSSPPRSNSRNGLRVDLGPGNTHPMPSLSEVHQEYPAHSPSRSGSSTTSSHSAGDASSRSEASPTISTTSSISALSSALDDGQYSGLDMRARPQQSLSRTRDRGQQPAFHMPVVQEVAWTPPARAYTDLVPAKQIPIEPHTVVPSRKQYPVEPPESPMDPAMYSELQPADPVQASQRPLLVRAATSDAEKLRELAPLPLRTAGLRSADGGARRPGTASKHVCRGCDEPIIGKSIKAADGRLTGRYHKHCFVCKTCQATFQTADFYVIDNHPYCEHHYHELNNSLCTGCNNGIEGQYLETQQSQKFHPRCLTCLTCREVLSDDYFEISGKVYCERHAFAAVRSQSSSLGPKRNMERRTTRLMMM